MTSKSKFYHGTNNIAMMQILESGYIKPLSKTHQMNLCKCTTTMLDNAIYLSTEFMFASFYKPNTKQIIDGQEAYGCVIELELDYDKTNFLPDEDYMDDILSLDDYALYKKYITPKNIKKYAPGYVKYVKDYNLNPYKYSDLEFRWLLSENKELGMKILKEVNVDASLDMGCVAYTREIPISCIKTIYVSDILSTSTDNISINGLNSAIDKVSLKDIELDLAI